MPNPNYFRLFGGPYDGRYVPADMAQYGRIHLVTISGNPRDMKSGPMPKRLAVYAAMDHGVALWTGGDDEQVPQDPRANIFYGRSDNTILKMIQATIVDDPG